MSFLTSQVSSNMNGLRVVMTHNITITDPAEQEASQLLRLQQ